MVGERYWRSSERPEPWSRPIGGVPPATVARRAPPLRHRRRAGPSSSSRASRARCRCTSAGRRSTARRTSATAASRSCSTCCAATSSGRARGHLRLEHHRHRRQHHRPGQRRGPARTEIAERVRGRVVPGHGRARREAARRTTRTPPPTSTRWSTSIGELVDAAWPTRRPTACTSQSSGSRATGCSPASRSTSLRAGARVETQRGEALPDRLRPLEEGQAGRAVVDSPWGAGPAGLAHRVRRHVARPARRGLRPPRRRPGPRASRTTRTSGPRRSRSASAFARHWVHNGFVEVGGEKMSKSLGNFTNLLDLVDDRRPARLPAAGAAVALPLADRGHRRRPSPTPRPSLGRLDRFARRVRRASGRRRARRRRRSSGSATVMDDDLDTPAAMALLFDLVRQANRARRRRHGRAPLAAASARSPAPSASSCGPTAARSTPRPPTWPAGATRPGPPRTGPRPTPSATELEAPRLRRRGHADRHGRSATADDRPRAWWLRRSCMV